MLGLEGHPSFSYVRSTNFDGAHSRKDHLYEPLVIRLINIITRFVKMDSESEEQAKEGSETVPGAVPRLV